MRTRKFSSVAAVKTLKVNKTVASSSYSILKNHNSLLKLINYQRCKPNRHQWWPCTERSGRLQINFKYLTTVAKKTNYRPLTKLMTLPSLQAWTTQRGFSIQMQRQKLRSILGTNNYEERATMRSLVQNLYLSRRQAASRQAIQFYE